MCKNPIFYDKTKPIEVKYHFIREKISQGVVKIEKISIEDNPTDIGTKVDTISKFKHCLKLLGVGKG